MLWKTRTVFIAIESANIILVIKDWTSLTVCFVIVRCTIVRIALENQGLWRRREKKSRYVQIVRIRINQRIMMCY